MLLTALSFLPYVVAARMSTPHISKPPSDFSAVFSSLRVYALSDRNLPLGLVVLILSLVPVATNSVSLIICISTQLTSDGFTVQPCRSDYCLRERRSARFVLRRLFERIREHQFLVSATLHNSWTLPQ